MAVLNPEYPPNRFFAHLVAVAQAAVEHGSSTPLTEAQWEDFLPDLGVYAGFSPRSVAINCFDTLEGK